MFPSHGPLSVGAEPKLEFYSVYLFFAFFSSHFPVCICSPDMFKKNPNTICL